jgi:phasin family protein
MLRCSIPQPGAGVSMGKSKGKAKGGKTTGQGPEAVVAPAAKTVGAAPATATASTPTTSAVPTMASGRPSQTAPAIPAIARQIVKGSTMNEQFQKFADIFNPKGFDQFLAPAKEQVEKAQAQSAKVLEDVAKFQKDNLEAVVSASNVYAKGFETFGKAWYALTQETVEASAAVAKALLGAKTLKEAVDLQTDFAKTTFDKFVAESTKLSEISIKVANEALEPINARVNVAVEKLLKPANAA